MSRLLHLNRAHSDQMTKSKYEMVANWTLDAFVGMPSLILAQWCCYTDYLCACSRSQTPKERKKKKFERASSYVGQIKRNENRMKFSK